MLRFLLAILAVFAVVLSAPAGPPVPGRGEPHIGAARCASCHATQYEWSKRDPHARAHLSLPPERRNDAKCTGCHSPDPGGVFAGVGCESCHGAGGAYSFSFVMKDRML